MRLPIVAIVGRPNVGKSTLFNRYAGERRALVENRPGITRDRVVAEIEVEGRALRLVDTAGLDPAADSGLPEAVQAQARAAVDQADAILFVVDGQQGRLPVDDALARMLHRTRAPVSVLVNKVDAPQHEPRVADFEAMGFPRCHGVSAEHGREVWEALETLVAALPPPAAEEAEADPGDPGVRIALVGRPNVGKSSLLNRLAGEERVVVSEVPGTTRDAVDIRIEHAGRTYTLVDTAGLRRAGRRDRIAEHGSALMTLRSLERAQVALMLLDASDGATEQDARIARLARDSGCACVLLANKWDLLKDADPSDRTRLEGEIEKRLRFVSDAPLLRVSAHTGAGVGRILAAVDRVASASGRRIATPELNRWLEKTVGRHQPAMAQRGPRRQPLKFQYATQTGVCPPTFVLFCTDPSAVQPSYRRFLENQLRESFDFAGAPVRLRLRARTR